MYIAKEDGVRLGITSCSPIKYFDWPGERAEYNNKKKTRTIGDAHFDSLARIIPSFK